MHTDRRTILILVLLGRITASEAERMLTPWDTAQEGKWVIAACIGIALTAQLNPSQLLPQLVRAAHALLPGLTLHHTLALFNHLSGGIV